MGRIELPTSPLPRECSTTEPHGRISKMLRNAGAGEGNRTLVISLEGFSSTIELHPQRINFNNLQHPQLTRLKHFNTFLQNNWWRELDSNQRRRKPTDLQSAPFSRSGISPGTLNFRLF